VCFAVSFPFFFCFWRALMFFAWAVPFLLCDRPPSTLTTYIVLCRLSDPPSLDLFFCKRSGVFLLSLFGTMGFSSDSPPLEDRSPIFRVLILLFFFFLCRLPFVLIGHLVAHPVSFLNSLVEPNAVPRISLFLPTFFIGCFSLYDGGLDFPVC